MADTFAALQQQFLSGIPARLTLISTLAARASDQANDSQPDCLIELRRELHKLAGAAACYQYPEIEAAAQACESWLDLQVTNRSSLSKQNHRELLNLLAPVSAAISASNGNEPSNR